MKVRRGLNQDRTSFLAEEGEPLWDTDTKWFYVGDGVTYGGVRISQLPDIVTIDCGTAALDKAGFDCGVYTDQVSINCGGA